MKIKYQILLLSLLLLTLPWAGYQFIQEIQSALRFGQIQAGKATAQAIATSLADSTKLLYPNPERLKSLLQQKNLASGEPDGATLNTADSHASAAKEFNNTGGYSVYAPIKTGGEVIDGYLDTSQENLLNVPINNFADLPLSYKFSQNEENYFLVLSITDDNPVFASPNPLETGSGDRLVILAGKNQQRKYFFSASSAGPVYARYIEGKSLQQVNALHGFWQQTEYGYTIELQLPKTVIGKHLGFYYEKPATTASTANNFAGTIRPDSISTPWIASPSPLLESRMKVFSHVGRTIHVTDTQGWVLSHTPAIEQTTEYQPERFWLLDKLYSYLLDSGEKIDNLASSNGQVLRPEVRSALQGKTDLKWYRQDNESEQHTLLSVATPILSNGELIGSIVIEDNSAPYTNLAYSALNRLLLLSFATLVITGLGLLAYASWLGWRIRKLSKAARLTIDDGGKVNRFFASRAPDEIGDLSRSFTALIKTLKEYTDYLRTLSSKLSHELRTPLAIIQSSLDNLDNEALPQQEKTYLDRAREGANRLGRIITSMSEASRVEESIRNSEFEHFNPVDLFRELSSAYQDTYKKRNIAYQENISNGISLYGSPDLLVQMLDKLISNADDFSPEDSTVTLSLEQHNDRLDISVSNKGPLLPDKMRRQLFDSMVSIRDKSSDETHLGLGLYIVKLVADAHYASVHAENLKDESGVCITVSIPLAFHT